MPEWQPIDTAPKDDDPLDLWVENRGWHNCVGAWRIADAKYHNSQWCVWSDDFEEWQPLENIEATHWMRVEGPVVDDSSRVEGPVVDDSPRIMEGLER